MSDDDFKAKWGSLLVAAQHQDQINSWHWLGRWLHRTFVAKRCPACRYWNEKRGR